MRCKTEKFKVYFEEAQYNYRKDTSGYSIHGQEWKHTQYQKQQNLMNWLYESKTRSRQQQRLKMFTMRSYSKGG